MAYTDFDETLDAYIKQESMHSFEGRRGVKAMCQLARAVGYKDPQYFGQLSSKAAIGDLIMMLEDNSGMIEAMLEWMRDRNVQEWKEALEEQLPEQEDDND